MTHVLTSEERSALYEIGKVGARPRLSKSVTDYLVSLGLVSENLSGFTLTADGQSKLSEPR